MFIKSLFIDGNILKYTIFIFLKLNSCFKAQLCHFMLQNYAFHEDNLNCRLNVFLLNINHISFNSCLFLYVTHSFEITIFCSFLLTFVSPFHHFSLNNYTVIHWLHHVLTLHSLECFLSDRLCPVTQDLYNCSNCTHKTVSASSGAIVLGPLKGHMSHLLYIT